ncbi:MAG: hypothetical protein M0R17_03375 [Candidatus Omnitrophica bacterium]|jgi:hypothetical protein|nr:hypothetical protein [Candidatus Omnitrophota bacterium]
MKLCKKCNDWKFKDEFNSRSAKCKTCYNEEYRIKRLNPIVKKLRKISLIKTVEHNQNFLIQYLLENPCKCGEKDIRCLEFHHLRDKKYVISHMLNMSLDTIKKEISKCKIMCSNCHKKETSIQFNWYKQKTIGV